MPVRRRLVRALLRLLGWRLTGEVPQSGILVGAPHTSRWDYLVMLAIAWGNGVSPHVLVAHTYFDGIKGWALRRTGGIPLDRDDPGDTIRAVLAMAAEQENFQLCIAPEGTRSKGEYWKSGFYRISGQTGLPVILGFVDGPSKTLGMGPALTPSGDVRADMDVVRAFYADKRGLKPENRTEPRLREEDEQDRGGR
ncbi:1-acyl-sn-glycerol-3-phosphate acyltransferase [Nocardioidaceae bacterium]|nr:1-acyl-sn-glycerol-3-phosphate acyltransferase [Nocardioidaceae bacterium]